MVSMSAVVSDLGWLSSSGRWVNDVFLGHLIAGHALAEAWCFHAVLLLGPDFLEPLIFGAFVLGILSIIW